MQVKRIIVGELQTNCYLVISTNKCLIIDPGAEASKIINTIGNLIPVAIIITHYHFDHVGALEELKKNYQIPVYDYHDLGIINIDPFNFEIISTKGHSNTGISIYFPKEKILFTGDFLFKGTIGRTDMLDSNPHLMIASINKIKEYSEDIIVYPGHGEMTSLKTEKMNNIYLN